jgi:hypothetical protein
MASIASVENRRALGRKTGELAYVKAFFKELTGKSQISSNDLRKVDSSYDPFVRGEATKVEYLRAIDILIESRGECFILLFLVSGSFHVPGVTEQGFSAPRTP